MFFEALYRYLISFNILALTFAQMFIDFVVSSLDLLALRALKHQLFKYFFDRSMQINQWISSLAFFAFPLSIPGEFDVSAFKAIDRCTFRTLLRLIDYKVADFA